MERQSFDNSLCAEPITTKYAGDIAYLTAAFMRQGREFKLHDALEHCQATPSERRDGSCYKVEGHRGLAHLSEAQVNAMTVSIPSSFITSASRSLSKLPMRRDSPTISRSFYARYVDNAICEEVGANPRA